MQIAFFLFLAVLLAPAEPLCGQPASRVPGDVPAHQLAFEAAALEVRGLEPQQNDRRFRSHTINNRGDLTRDTIESRDGTVARLIAVDSRPLTPAEDAAERSRLQAMLDSPATFARHVRNEQSNKKQAIEMIKLIPDAMLFTYAEGQPQPSTIPKPADLIALDYVPNPAWSPPGLTAEMLTGLRGRLWLDQHTHHIVELDVSVFRPVNVGFGVLAKVFPGGTVMMTQTTPVQDRWPIAELTEHVSLRALMVKTYKEDAQIHNSGFTQIPPLSYQEAVKLLLATQMPH